MKYKLALSFLIVIMLFLPFFVSVAGLRDFFENAEWKRIGRSCILQVKGRKTKLWYCYFTRTEMLIEKKIFEKLRDYSCEKEDVYVGKEKEVMGFLLYQRPAFFTLEDAEREGYEEDDFRVVNTTVCRKQKD